ANFTPCKIKIEKLDKNPADVQDSDDDPDFSIDSQELSKDEEITPPTAGRPRSGRISKLPKRLTQDYETKMNFSTPKIKEDGFQWTSKGGYESRTETEKGKSVTETERADFEQLEVSKIVERNLSLVKQEVQSTEFSSSGIRSRRGRIIKPKRLEFE
ncbi:unnamed protein product, partial [Meganyctiphanes norvegica]